MGRPSKKAETDTRYGVIDIQDLNTLETKLAATAVEVKETAKSKREALLNTKVVVYQAHKRGYSKEHLAKTLKTSKNNITNYIQAVEAGLKMAAMVRGTEIVSR